MMDPADKELLIVRRPELVENVDVTGGLFTQLLSRKVLSSRSVQNITYNKPPDRQVEELLDLLPKRGPKAFELFCEALIADDQEDVVNSILRKPLNTTSSNLAASTTCTSQTALTSLTTSASTPSVSSNASSPQPTVSGPPELESQGLTTPGGVENVPSTSQKRKLDNSENRGPEENEDNSGTSETDSCQVQKRVRPDSPSVICIKGNDDKNVFKIYLPQTGGKPQQFVEQAVGMLTQCASHTGSPFPQSAHQYSKQNGTSSLQQISAQNGSSPYLSGEQSCERKFTDPTQQTLLQHSDQNDIENKPFQPGEYRYVLKHFISTDTDKDRSVDANRRLAESMLSGLPEECLKLLSSGSKSYTKTAGEQDSNSCALMRERLTRCDSTDTMEQTSGQIHVEGTQQPDSAHGFPPPVLLSQSATMAPALMRTPVDLPDGPVSVRVEHSTRQFYQSMKHKAYRMVGMPRGEALIINVNEVHDKPPRRGTDIDRDNLKNLLSQLHFNVTVYNDKDDLTALGIVNKLKAFAAKREHLSADASILCLLSHGEEGFIFGTDGKRIPLDEIFLLFDNHRCPALLNKPKIFFIQACRGGALDRGVKIPIDETDGGPGPQSAASLVQHPSMSDMLICYPTLEGYYAWRNRERGSWYIEAVVQVFMRYAKSEDVCAMLNRVNELVSRKVSRCPQVEMDRMSQMSEYKSSLRKPYLFLFPGIGSPAIGPR